MNAIAWLGRLVIERIKRIGAAAPMLPALFSMPSQRWLSAFCVPDVSCRGDVPC